MAGATGATGREIARLLAANPAVSKLVLLSRRDDPKEGLHPALLKEHSSTAVWTDGRMIDGRLALL